MAQLQAATRVVNDKMAETKASVIYIKWQSHGRKENNKKRNLKNLKYGVFL